MGTKSENDSQSGTVEPGMNDFEAIANAVNNGKFDELDRLMAVDPKSENPDKAPEDSEEEDKSAVEDNADNENPEQKVTEGKDDEEGEGKSDKKPDSGEPTEAASAASTASKDNDLEELRQRLHRAQSDAGRVPYLQRQLAELQRQLRAQRARDVEDATQKDKKPARVSINDVELDEETQKSIDDLKDIDPVLAKTIERVAKAAVASATATATQKVDHVVTAFTEEDQRADDERFYAEQSAILTQQVPNAGQIFASPEWKQWKDMLTPGQRALAESGYANEVIQAIYAFAADMQKLHGNEKTAAPVKTEETNTSPQEKTEVKESRERKMSGAAETKAPAAKATKELDADAYFNEMHAKLLKENHIL